MKIYAAKTHTIEQFIGKDMWVNIIYSPANFMGHYEWFVRPLSISGKRITCNLVGTDISWEQRAWSEDLVAQVLKDRVILDTDHIELVHPLNVLTTDEVISQLYDGDYIDESDFHIRPGRGIEVHDFDRDELSYIEDEDAE